MMKRCVFYDALEAMCTVWSRFELEDIAEVYSLLIIKNIRLLKLAQQAQGPTPRRCARSMNLGSERRLYSLGSTLRVSNSSDRSW